MLPIIFLVRWTAMALLLQGARILASAPTHHKSTSRKRRPKGSVAGHPMLSVDPYHQATPGRACFRVDAAHQLCSRKPKAVRNLAGTREPTTCRKLKPLINNAISFECICRCATDSRNWVIPAQSNFTRTLVRVLRQCQSLL